MRTQLAKIALIVIAVDFALSMAFAADVPRYCAAEIIAISKGNDFDMQKFIGSLPPAVVKAKMQAKMPFGQPKDSDKMAIGMTFGCLKSFPESPAEIQSLLENVIPQPQAEPQYTQPPPQQPQYIYPPPQQAQPQYVYPPPQQAQPQYVYPPPPQGQPQYIYLPQQPQYIYVAQPELYQQQLGNFSTGERWGTWALNTIIPGLGSAAIMNDYLGMGIQIGLTALGITFITALGWEEDCHYSGYYNYCDEGTTMFLPIGFGLLGVNQIFNIVRSASYNKPRLDYNQNDYDPNDYSGFNYNGFSSSLEYNQYERNFSTEQRWGTWALNTVIPGLGSAAIMNDYIGMGIQIGVSALGIISMTSDNLLAFGILLLSGNFIYNIVRSATYDKPANDNIYSEYSGLNLTVLPNRHGEIMPALMYSKTF